MQFAVAHASASPTDNIPLEYSLAFVTDIFVGLIVHPPILPAAAFILPDNINVPFGFKCINDDEISILSPEPEIYDFNLLPTKKLDALKTKLLPSN